MPCGATTVRDDCVRCANDCESSRQGRRTPAPAVWPYGRHRRIRAGHARPPGPRTGLTMTISSFARPSVALGTCDWSIYPVGAGLPLSARLDIALHRVEKRGGDPVSVAARAVSLLVAFLVVVGLGVFVALYYIGSASTQLPTVHYSASGGQVNVVLQEDPQNNSSSKPELGQLLRPGSVEQSVDAHDVVLGPGQHQGQHDHLRLRRLHAAAEQLLQPGAGHHRQHGDRLPVRSARQGVRDPRRPPRSSTRGPTAMSGTRSPSRG